MGKYPSPFYFLKHFKLKILNFTVSTGKEVLDYLKSLIKDKGGTFALGIIISGGIGLAYYKSEKRVKEYVEADNKRLQLELQECKEGRKTDKQEFFGSFKEVYNFTRELRTDYNEAEEISRKSAEEKNKNLKK